MFLGVDISMFRDTVHDWYPKHIEQDYSTPQLKEHDGKLYLGYKLWNPPYSLDDINTLEKRMQSWLRKNGFSGIAGVSEGNYRLLVKEENDEG